MILADIQGRICAFNTAAERTFGVSRAEAIGKRLAEILVRPDEQARLEAEIHGYLRSGNSSVVGARTELTAVRSDGTGFPAELTLALFARDGFLTLVAQVRDFTEARRQERALLAARSYGENLIASSLDMIIAVDLSRTIMEFNPAAERSFGYVRAEVFGRTADMLYSDPGEGMKLHIQALTRGYRGEVHNRRKSGELFESHLSASVMRNASDEVIGVLGISREITSAHPMCVESGHAIPGIAPLAMHSNVLRPASLK